MKKLFILLSLIFVVSLIGCSSESSTKNDYNVAYVKFYTYIYDDVSFNVHYDNFTKNDGSTYTGDQSYTCLAITKWEYGSNDTVILYLKDGRVLQTSFDNVMLMHDANFE